MTDRIFGWMNNEIRQAFVKPAIEVKIPDEVNKKNRYKRADERPRTCGKKKFRKSKKGKNIMITSY